MYPCVLCCVCRLCLLFYHTLLSSQLHYSCTSLDIRSSNLFNLHSRSPFPNSPFLFAFYPSSLTAHDVSKRHCSRQPEKNSHSSNKNNHLYVYCCADVSVGRQSPPVHQFSSYVKGCSTYFKAPSRPIDCILVLWLSVS